jgi:hypothetical protein
MHQLELGQLEVTNQIASLLHLQSSSLPSAGGAGGRRQPVLCLQNVEVHVFHFSGHLIDIILCFVSEVVCVKTSKCIYEGCEGCPAESSHFFSSPASCSDDKSE